MENDTSFADLDHFNVISDQFGIHFNSVLRKHVIGTNWEQGKIAIDGDGPIFHQPAHHLRKDVCTISVSRPARSVLDEGGDIFMATAKYGKGTVFAMIDPWLYNEYTDGRKLPAMYDNYAAGKEFVRWVLTQVPHENHKQREGVTNSGCLILKFSVMRGTLGWGDATLRSPSSRPRNKFTP